MAQHGLGWNWSTEVFKKWCGIAENLGFSGTKAKSWNESHFLHIETPSFNLQNHSRLTTVFFSFFWLTTFVWGLSAILHVINCIRVWPLRISKSKKKTRKSKNTTLPVTSWDKQWTVDKACTPHSLQRHVNKQMTGNSWASIFNDVNADCLRKHCLDRSHSTENKTYSLKVVMECGRINSCTLRCSYTVYEQRCGKKGISREHHVIIILLVKSLLFHFIGPPHFIVDHHIVSYPLSAPCL